MALTYQRTNHVEERAEGTGDQSGSASTKPSRRRKVAMILAPVAAIGIAAGVGSALSSGGGHQNKDNAPATAPAAGQDPSSGQDTRVSIVPNYSSIGSPASSAGSTSAETTPPTASPQTQPESQGNSSGSVINGVNLETQFCQVPGINQEVASWIGTAANCSTSVEAGFEGSKSVDYITKWNELPATNANPLGAGRQVFLRFSKGDESDTPGSYGTSEQSINGFNCELSADNRFACFIGGQAVAELTPPTGTNDIQTDRAIMRYALNVAESGNS